ncbi:MAG: hypothetical protein ACE5WD_07895 [Candidatus Aminicenantia bacterium]
MRFKKVLLIIPGILLSLLIFNASPKKQPTQEELKKIINASLKAQGGKKALHSIRNFLVLSIVKIYVPQGEFTMERKTYLQKNPFKIRIEQSVTIFQSIIGFDGQKVWLKQKEKVTDMPLSYIRSFKASAKRENLLIKYTPRYFKIEYAGREKIREKECIGIKFTDPEGNETILYFYLENFLPAKEEYISLEPTTGKMVKNESILFDYRLVKKVKMPFRVIAFQDGQKIAEVLVKEIQINLDLKDDLFRKPPTK